MALYSWILSSILVGSQCLAYDAFYIAQANSYLLKSPIELYKKKNEESQVVGRFEILQKLQPFASETFGDKISDIFKYVKPYVNVNFDFGYKGISITESQIPEEFRFEALEEALVKGFEASESMISYYRMGKQLSFSTRLFLSEKYTTTKNLDKESRILEPFESNFKQTLKYGLGVQWQKLINQDKNIAIEIYYMQRMAGLWKIRNLLPEPSPGEPLTLDSLNFSLSWKI